MCAHGNQMLVLMTRCCRLAKRSFGCVFAARGRVGCAIKAFSIAVHRYLPSFRKTNESCEP